MNYATKKEIINALEKRMAEVIPDQNARHDVGTQLLENPKWPAIFNGTGVIMCWKKPSGQWRAMIVDAEEPAFISFVPFAIGIGLCGGR